MENLNFTKIIEIKKRIDANLIKVELTLDDLKKILIKLNTLLNVETSYLGLDSFNFQIKLIDIKIDNLRKIYLVIKNRMYKDYYRIYKKVKKYLEERYLYVVKDKKYPVYKELELDKIYDFNNVIKIREEIEEFIKFMDGDISLRKRKLLDFKDSESKGLMCNNYIIEEESEINSFEEKLNLYIKHLQTYDKYHYIYLVNCLNEIKNLLIVINKEIKIKKLESNKLIENNSEDINLTIKEHIILPNENSILEEKSDNDSNDDINDNSNDINDNSNDNIEINNREIKDDRDNDNFKDLELGDRKEDNYKDLELGNFKYQDKEIREIREIKEEIKCNIG